MIPAVPFSVLNYAAGASAVRVLPYTLATFVGLLPGTAAVVILGDALTGNVSPLLFAGLVVHREPRRRGLDLRDPHAPAPPPRAPRRVGRRLRARDHRLTSGPFAVTTPKITAKRGRG